jgi:EpsD family peptidyl-prolyl cis-trans isomerase
MLVALLLPIVQSGARAQDVGGRNVIVTVGEMPITREDLELALKDRIKSGIDLSTNPQLPAAVLKDLIVELAAKNVVSAKEIARDPEFSRRLESVRREMLLRYYLEKNIKPRAITPYDVEKFIQEHPDFFQGRMIYHYSNILIAPSSEGARKALRERLKTLAENKEIDSKSIERFLQWLLENNINYGYTSAWTPTNKLQQPLDKVIPEAVQKNIKLYVNESDSKTWVVAIYSAQPDPINPLMGRSIAIDRIQEDYRAAQFEPTIKKLLSRANVVIYDDAMKNSLSLPNAAQGQYEDRLPIRQRLPVLWNFALFLLAPIALYLFFRSDAQPINEGAPSSTIDRVLDHIAFRAVATLALAGFIGATMYEVLDAAYVALDAKDFLINGGIGLAAAAILIALVAFVPRLRELLSMRWLPVSIILAVQFAMVTLSA